MTYDMQAGQAVAAGYFGGYSAKMQEIGNKELDRLRDALNRKSRVLKACTSYESFPGLLAKARQGLGGERYHPHVCGDVEPRHACGRRRRAQR